MTDRRVRTLVRRAAGAVLAAGLVAGMSAGAVDAAGAHQGGADQGGADQGGADRGFVAVSGYRVPLVLGESPASPTFVPPSGAAGAAGDLGASGELSASAATITVTYDAGFNANPAAKAAFQAAVNVWKAKLTSTVPITVNASFAPLPTGVLGSAGPWALGRDFPNAPVAGTLYPIATANALAGTDLLPASPDIGANFSSTFPSFYFGTDGHPGASKLDFMSVVLHELGHGLGFLGTVRVAGGVGEYGLSAPLDNHSIYDRRVRSNGTLITSYANHSAALATAVVGKTLTFDAVNAKAGNGGVAPRLYAPATWQQGSSYSHLDEGTYPAGNANSLMTPAIGLDEAIHDPGPITMGMFKDLGWQTVAPAKPRVSIGGAQVVEGATGSRAARFTISLSQTSTLPVTVAYATLAGTATATTDYVTKTGSVSIPAGSTSTSVSILVKGDATVEPNETYSVKLSAPVNATLGRATGAGLVIDDDPSSNLRIAIGNATIEEGKTGNRALRFTVSLSGPSAGAVSISWATAPGSATATTDFVTASGTVSIPAGSTSNVVSVVVRGDGTVEPDEKFTVRLSSPIGGVIVHKSTGTGTILNDD